MFTCWSRSTSNFCAPIGQNLTGKFMRKIYAASGNLFTLIADADRVLCRHLVMFLTVFFHWMYKMKYVANNISRNWLYYSIFVPFIFFSLKLQKSLQNGLKLFRYEEQNIKTYGSRNIRQFIEKFYTYCCSFSTRLNAKRVFTCMFCTRYLRLFLYCSPHCYLPSSLKCYDGLSNSVRDRVKPTFRI